VSKCVGPVDPFGRIGDWETVDEGPHGTKLLRLAYADGFVYLLAIPRGGTCDPEILTGLPEGVWMDAWHPYMNGETDDPHIYVSVWVSNN